MLSIDFEKKTRVELPATIHIYQLEQYGEYCEKHLHSELSIIFGSLHCMYCVFCARLDSANSIFSQNLGHVLVSAHCIYYSFCISVTILLYAISLFLFLPFLFFLLLVFLSRSRILTLSHSILSSLLRPATIDLYRFYLFFRPLNSPLFSYSSVTL